VQGQTVIRPTDLTIRVRRGTKMRTRLIGGFVVLLLLVPAAAFAVDTDVDLETICYVDPLDPRCVDVGDVDVEEPVDEEPVDEEPVEVIDEEEELDEAEVLGVTVERDAAVLAVTGADVGVIACSPPRCSGPAPCC
jgi:hypothetical protein